MQKHKGLTIFSHDQQGKRHVQFFQGTMGAKSIARGSFTANYYTLKLVFWQTKVMVLKDSVLTAAARFFKT
jgi:hypothetical protein